MNYPTKDFGHAICTYSAEDTGVVVMGWKTVPNIPIGTTFWDDVRTWFNEQMGTSIIIAGIIGETAVGQEFTRKLQGKDGHHIIFPASGVPITKQVRVLTPRFVDPDNWGLARI